MSRCQITKIYIKSILEHSAMCLTLLAGICRYRGERSRVLCVERSLTLARIPGQPTSNIQALPIGFEPTALYVLEIY